MLTDLQLGNAADYGCSENVQSLFDFGLMILGMCAIAVGVIIVVLCIRGRRLRRLTNPRKDYYR